MARDIFDPARYTSCSVKCVQNNSSNIQNNEKGRFQTVLNKLSQFDPLSKYVTKGKSLLKISNRIYDSKIIPKSFADGIGGVVDHFGVKPFLDITSSVNFEMAGITKSKLENISNKVRAGNLKFKDVDDIARNLSSMTKYAQNIFSSPQSPEEEACICEDVFNPAKYIADHYFPKYSSWFCVEFEFTDGYKANITPLPTFAFLCTKATRPTIKFDIEEVNKYNQRVFVQKRSEYEPLDLTFIDDDKNITHTNFETMLRLLVPNMNLQGAPKLSDVMAFNTSSVGITDQLDDSAEVFKLPKFSISDNDGSSPIKVPDVPKAFQTYAGSIAPYYEPYMKGNGGGFYIKQINVYQVYRWGNFVNKFQYFNPIMSSCAFSEINAVGDVESSVSTSFRYGSMTISTEEITSSVADKLKEISTGKEGSDALTVADGSYKSPKVQLGPDSKRLAKYGITTKNEPNFLDKAVKVLVNKAKELANGLKTKLLSFAKKHLTDPLASLGKLLGGSAKSIAKGLGDALTGGAVTKAIAGSGGLLADIKASTVGVLGAKLKTFETGINKKYKEIAGADIGNDKQLQNDTALHPEAQTNDLRKTSGNEGVDVLGGLL